MQQADATRASPALSESPPHRATRRLRRPAVLCSCLILASASQTTFAQQAPGIDAHADYAVRHWTVRNGLPSNTINDILVASDGYVWLATIEGLARFDGQRFTVFNATNSRGLPGNRILQIVEAPAGHLWIRSQPDALTHYHDGVFTRVDIPDDTTEVQRIIYTEQETAWVLTGNGLAHNRDGQMSPYRPPGVDSDVTSVVRDSAGRLWIGTAHGSIHRVELDGTVRHYTAEDGVPVLPVSGLLVDGTGKLWVALQGGVLHIDTDRVQNIPHPRGRWPDPTRLLVIDDDGGVWVSAGPEWWRFDSLGTPGQMPASPRVARLGQAITASNRQVWRVEMREQPGTPGRAGFILRANDNILRVDKPIERIVLDSSDAVWVGTNGSGLLRLLPSPRRVVGRNDGLPNENVYPILEDSQGRIWIGTFGDGVVRLGTTPFQPAMGGGDGGGFTLSLHEDSDGSILVGRFGPTCRIVGSTCVNMNLASVGSRANGVRAMHQDRQGRFWLGGNNGLALGLGPPGERTWQTIDIAAGRSPPGAVRAIVELRDGEVLFGTNGGGVLRYASDESFEVFGTRQGLPSDNVRDIYEDVDGYIWIALEDRGLCRLDRRGERGLEQSALACVDTRAGLYNDGLHRLLEDAQGRFWFNTNIGIFHVDRSALNAYLDGTIPAITSVGYSPSDGIPNREGNGGMQPAGVRSRNGELWFPTRNGVVVIDPASIPVPAPPRVAIEGVRIDGASRAISDTVALQTSRDVAVQYTAIEFDHPEAVRFQYRLSGYDDEWQYAGDQRATTYTNLAAGSYVFEVRAQLGTLWGAPAQVIVTRSGYAWEQTWFLGLMGLLVLGAIYATYRVRMRQVAARNEQLEQIVADRTAELRSKTEELQEANSLKSRFLANITHEFRTPLTLTFGPIDDLLKGRFAVDDAARPHLERARSNGSRLMRLINQLLDLSRLDAHALVLHPERRDLASHMRQLAALFATLASERRIQFVLQIPNDPWEHVYDADVLERVVINLLSNAFKFTEPGDKVSLTLARDSDGAARIEVADTGPGIAAEHLKHLFDRFYQVESSSTRAHEGTGIGLALVKELVDLHGGEISVESTPGFGTSFVVILPRREAATAPMGVPGYGERTPNERSLYVSMPHALKPMAEQDRRVVPRTASADDPPLVLVVEDSADMRAYIRSHLDDDFEIIEAVNGRDGFALASEEVPDLVLSDVMMPEVDGLELCAMLKADERTSHIPVVLLTARSQVEDRIEGFESGADGYLSKPFDAQELRVRVRTLVEDRRRLRARFATPPSVFPNTSNAAVSEVPAASLPPREAAFLDKVQQEIEARLSDSQFGVDRLAEEMCMSPRQLYRKLNAVTGETPAGLIRRLRMKRARDLLSTGRVSVKEVAYQVGFRSRPSFSAAYRQEYGVSPSDSGERP